MDCLKGCTYTAAVLWSSIGLGQVVAFVGVPLALISALVAKIGQGIINCCNSCGSKKEGQQIESKRAKKWGNAAHEALSYAKVLAIAAIPVVGASILAYKMFQGS